PPALLRHSALWSIPFPLPDGPATIVRLPGVPAPGPAHAALFAAARRIEGTRVFVAGPGATATALWAARANVKVLYWTENVAEAQSLAETLKRNDCTERVTLTLQADFAGLEPTSCDLALLHLPRGQAFQAELLQAAGALLRPGTRLIFVGAKNEGVKGAAAHAQALCGQAGIVAHKGGYHAGLAVRPPGDFALPPFTLETRDITLDGIPTRLCTGAGVFAAGRLDDGAAALIAGMRVTPGAPTLDVGCGAGVAGLAALRRGAAVALSDVSARAVAATRATLAANGYPDAPVTLTCGAGDFADAAFETVLANPPFHSGRGVDFEVSQLFVSEAARVLRPGGVLYLVANRFLPYGPWLAAAFAHVGVAWEDTRFRVWEATK
ncbi:MAG TPA: methyltransferase, partial [Anaerolineae bacterium]|nr:methyltransferase [Anaerolineae bacterium]